MDEYAGSYPEPDYSQKNCYEAQHQDKALRNGSDEYWRYKDAAERIYRAKCNSRTADERRYWTGKGLEMADTLTGRYGADDPSAFYIINEFYLDRTD